MLKNLYNKLATFYRGEPAITSTKGFNDFSTFKSIVNNNQDIMINPYLNNVWVYSAIHTISQNISQVPFLFYENIQNENKLVTDGDLVNLFNNPNPLSISSRQLIEATMVYLSLRGEAFWILSGRQNITQIPSEIWCLEPTRFEAILDNQNMLIGWKYQGKKVMEFSLDEIIHFKYFNPHNDIRGLSPLQAARMSVEQDMYANKFNSNFFLNGATVGGIISFEDGLTDDQYERLRNQFNDRHQGYNKSHNMMILEGKSDYKEAILSQKDMDFIELKKLSRSEIFAAFKVNEVILGLYEDIKSYEGIKTAHKTYWQECLMPKIKYIESVLYTKLFSKINGGAIVGKFDLSNVEALQEDFHKKVETAQKLWAMGIPFNALNKRLELGFEDIEGLDVGYIPFSLVEVGSQPTLPAGNDSQKQITQKNIKKFNNDKLWNNYIKRQAPVENKFLSGINNFFDEQEERLLKNLATFYDKSVSNIQTRDMTGDLFNDDIENKEIKILFKQLYLLSLKTGAEIVAEQSGNINFIFEPYAETFLATLKKRFDKFLPDINKTTKEAMRKTIRAGVSEGESITKIAQQIQKEYKNIKANRSMAIARTESAAAIQEGKQVQMKKENIGKHQWITAADEHVRDSHQLLEGSVSGIDDYFKYVTGSSSKLKYPGDSNAGAAETINCRCDTIPIFD